MKNREKIVAGETNLGYASSIARTLGVSRSSVSRWLAGLDKPSRLASERINSIMPELWSVINEKSRLDGNEVR